MRGIQVKVDGYNDVATLVAARSQANRKNCPEWIGIRFNGFSFCLRADPSAESPTGDAPAKAQRRRGYPKVVAPQNQSIRQNPYPDALPDFRNVGVLVRILLFVNLSALAAAAVGAGTLAEIAGRFTVISAWMEPELLVAVIVLYGAASTLLRLPYWAGVLAVLAIAVSSSVATAAALDIMMKPEDGQRLAWHAAWALLAGMPLLEYFRLRNRAFSPALSDARLQALQARIRPHFLFNSINAVLSLMRREPRRAETALEDLAELFRNLMADNRALTTFGEEVSLTRQYLNLEQLRMGDRLVVDWQVDAPTEAAAVPPLLLQPLVENAVYHGVEPGVGPGRVDIHAKVQGDELRIMIANPYHPDHQHRRGNHMALDNIRERLQLHFDVDARLDTGVETEQGVERFVIRMRLPYRKLKAPRQPSAPPVAGG
jgi:two-component system sensor histidine kinase AlgZ